MATLAKIYDRERTLDQAVITFFPGPSSYTGEDMVEICTHGSPYIVGKTLKLLMAAGARLADPGEFTQRSYIHGRMDLSQAEAVGNLIRAKTEFAHRAALNQLEGGLSSAIYAFRSEVLELLVNVEASLDHPDEDLPAMSDADLAIRLEQLRERISALLQTHRLGRLFVEGARIAIAGRPNVGKSSLLNALLGRKRAIVSEIPGTTRDTIEEIADVDGLQAVFIDTAGLRQTSADPVEREGMERTRTALATCDIALLVFDRSRALAPEDLQIAQEICANSGAERRATLAVINKIDLPAFPGIEQSIRRLIPPTMELIPVSAVTGLALPDLIQAIARSLKSGTPNEESGTVITSLRHRDCLEHAIAALEKSRTCLGKNELAALHLRECLSALAGIVGETTSEAVLKSIFSKFCIGK
jgi:tRNA modification GTPase